MSLAYSTASVDGDGSLVRSMDGGLVSAATASDKATRQIKRSATAVWRRATETLETEWVVTFTKAVLSGKTGLAHRREPKHESTITPTGPARVLMQRHSEMQSGSGLEVARLDPSR